MWPCGSLFCVGWENPGQQGIARRPSPASELSLLPLGCSVRPAASFGAFRDLNQCVLGSFPSSSFASPAPSRVTETVGLLTVACWGFVFNLALNVVQVR